MVKKVGRYELGKTLGTGNFSKVKLGIDEEGGQWAVKIVDKQLLIKEHMEEQFKREIAVMKILKHENIVQLREVLQTANHIYLILEIVSGGELFDKIVAAKKFDENVSRRYFQMLCMGVLYCHEQGIAHRDLKPENLLLDDKDVVKISDFGLSNLQRGGAKGDGTLLQTVCGTPNYVAPEVLREKGYNGFQADVWSCGVILFVMLAGYLPFDDPNMNHLFNKIERGEFRMAKHFSEPTKDIISKMLTVDPTQRYTLRQVIAHPWFQVGFDKACLERSLCPKVELTNDQLSAAMKDVEEKGEGKSTKPSDSSNVKTAEPVKTGLDVFDLMVKFTTNNVTPALASAGASVVLKPTTKILFQGTFAEAVTLLETMKASPKPKEDANEIKGFVQAPKGLLTYVIVVVPTASPSLLLLEFKRGRGDTLDFHEFFRNVHTAFGAKAKSKYVESK